MTQTLVSNEVAPAPYDRFDRMPMGTQWRGGGSGRVYEDRDPRPPCSGHSSTRGRFA